MVMTNSPNDIRRPFPKRISRFIAKKRLGKSARPEEVDEYAKFYEDWIGKPLALGVAAKVYHTVTGGVEDAENSTPIATAPLPPPLPSTSGLRKIPNFDWPLGDALSAHITCSHSALFFDLSPRVTKSLYINTVASGIVTAVFCEKWDFMMPLFGIVICHSANLYSTYWGWGESLVRQENIVKRSEKIALFEAKCGSWIFEASQGHQVVDPRRYMPTFPRVPEIEGHLLHLLLDHADTRYLWCWRLQMLEDANTHRR